LASPKRCWGGYMWRRAMVDIIGFALVDRDPCCSGRRGWFATRGRKGPSRCISSATFLLAMAGGRRVLLPLVVRGSVFAASRRSWRCFYVILASSLNLVVGYVGEFLAGSYRVFSLVVGAYTAALLSNRLLGLPIVGHDPACGRNRRCVRLMPSARSPCVCRGLISSSSRSRSPKCSGSSPANWVGTHERSDGPCRNQPGRHRRQTRLLFTSCSRWLRWSLYLCYRFVYSNIGRGAVLGAGKNRLPSPSRSAGQTRSAWRCGHSCSVHFLRVSPAAFYAHYISFVGPEVFNFAFTASHDHHGSDGRQGQRLIGPILGAVMVTVA